MRFFEVLAQVVGLLVLEQRLSYQALKRLCDLDDAYLEDIKVEIIEVRRLARDHEGRILVWTGEGLASPTPLMSRGASPLVAPDSQPTPMLQPPVVALTADGIVKLTHRETIIRRRGRRAAPSSPLTPPLPCR